MFLMSIFNSESRRSGTDRRKSNISESIGNERRNNTDRRKNGDRRSVIGRRAGVYYRLSDDNNDIVEKIILSLESKNWSNW